MAKNRLLFVDDEETAREVAKYNLKRAGYEVDLAASGEEALGAFDAKAHSVVITDLRLPGLDGLGLMSALRARRDDLAVIVVTAFGDIGTAVEAMRLGAYDFLPKPFNRDQLTMTVARAMERASLLEENRRLLAGHRDIERPIVHQSEVMKRTLALVDRIGASGSTALITGDSGTGKELVARRLHARSGRAEKAFVAINCAAIPGELMESAFFGHEAGSFTGASRRREGRFQQAHGGTLFLDEVAELPLGLQSKLLRVIQEGEVTPLGADVPTSVDVRLVAATNRPLDQWVRDGRFREDLYYRLNVLEIRCPPLRERMEDLPLLAQHFIEASAFHTPSTLPKAVLDTMMAYDWPGNIRELQNACERLAVLSPGGTFRVEDLPLALLKSKDPPEADRSQWLKQRPRDLSLFDLERLVIEHSLEATGGNLSAAARDLGVPRHILAYRVEKFGIRPLEGEGEG